jgi:hypothetical protein
MWSETWSLTTVPPVGIDEIEDEAFNIYPNPASDFIFIESGSSSNQAATVTISDILGKEMIRKEISFNGDKMNTIAIGDLTKGLYLVRIENGETPFLKKLIVR